MRISFPSERSQRQLAYLALFYGLLSTAAGFVGIWAQGASMYDGTPLHRTYDVLTYDEVFWSICLTSLAIITGSMTLSWVILASKITERFSVLRKNGILAILAVIFVAGILISSRIAAVQSWSAAEAAAKRHFESSQTNTLTSPKYGVYPYP